jgi:S1-C subfamily serine protease
MYRSLKISVLVVLLAAVTAIGQEPDQHSGYVHASADRANTPWVVTVVHTIDLQKMLARVKQQQRQNVRIGVPASVPPFVYNIATGVVVDLDGHVVTRLGNLDPSERGKQVITVNAADGSTMPARLVGVDYATGFVVLEVPSLKATLPKTTQAESLAPGTPVRILSTDVSQRLVGNEKTSKLYLSPTFKESQGRILSGGPYTTRGALTLLSDDFRLRSDSSVITDFDNHLIGLAQYAGFGRALVFPFSFLRDTVVKRVVDKQADVPAGWLGISGETALIPDESGSGQQEARGVVVREVVANSPASTSGIRPDDLITAVDGQSVASTMDLRALLSSYPAGARVSVHGSRENTPFDYNVVLGPKAIDDPGSQLQIYTGIQSSPAAEINALKARLEELKRLYRVYEKSPSAEQRDTLRELSLELRYVTDNLRALEPGGPSPAKQTDSRGPDQVLGANSNAARPGQVLISPEAEIERRVQISLGFWARELNAQLSDKFGARGMLVDAVVKGSPADLGGLKVGDVIVAVGERTMLNLDQLQATIASQTSQCNLTVVRSKQPVSLTISFVK